MNDAGGIRDEVRIMSDHNNSVAGVMDGFKFVHDNAARATIEVAGGFIGKDNFGMGGKSAGNGDALFLAAGKLGGHVIFLSLKMEVFESF